MCKKLEMIYEGKAKKVYKTDEPEVFLIEYKDDATAFNGLKKGSIENKGELNNKISAIFFELLEQKGIHTHFLKRISDRECLVRPLKIVLVEVVVRNIVAGSLSKRLGLSEGTLLEKPIIEYYYKSDELGDPLVNDLHIEALRLATLEQMEEIKEVSFKVNEILVKFLGEKNITLIDYKLEFGTYKGKILLGDEISPDTCRFWDKNTQEKMDKDRFRRDLGKVEDAYQEVYHRLVAE